MIQLDYMHMRSSGPQLGRRPLSFHSTATIHWFSQRAHAQTPEIFEYIVVKYRPCRGRRAIRILGVRHFSDATGGPLSVACSPFLSGGCGKYVHTPKRREWRRERDGLLGIASARALLSLGGVAACDRTVRRRHGQTQSQQAAASQDAADQRGGHRECRRFSHRWGGRHPSKHSTASGFVRSPSRPRQGNRGEPTGSHYRANLNRAHDRCAICHVP